MPTSDSPGSTPSSEPTGPEATRRDESAASGPTVPNAEAQSGPDIAGDGAAGDGTQPNGGAEGVTTSGTGSHERQRWYQRLLGGPERSNPRLGPATEASTGQVRLRPVAFGFSMGLGLAFVVLLWILLASLDQLLMWIALALFIALGLDPVVRFFERRGWPRIGGVLVVLGGFVAVAGTVLALLIPQLVTQITQLVNHAPEIIDSVVANSTVQSIDEHLGILDELETRVDDALNSPDVLGGIFNGVVTAGTVVGQVAFGALIVFVLAMYILVSLPGLKTFAYSIVPASRRARTSQLTEQITAGVGNYVIGQATVAICNAVFAFILMSIVGVPYRALLSIGVAMLAFVPLVGGVCAGILVLLVALFDPGWQAALTYAIFYFSYLQVEAYLISPKIMSRAVKVPGAVAVIAVVAGGSLLGILGALMAIPVAAAVLLLVKEIWVKRQDAR